MRETSYRHHPFETRCRAASLKRRAAAMSDSKHTIYGSLTALDREDVTRVLWTRTGEWMQASEVEREIERLRTENARLREDAERYRWLRDREIPEWLDLWHQNPDRIDAAIDEAMEKEVSND